MLTKEEQLQKISEEISKIEKKENNMIFFIPDTKGNPSGSLQYIYRIALALQKNGYNVKMIHQEPEFVGPVSWLGEEFSELRHYNVEKDNVEISSSDFLFIPEIYSNIFTQVKDLPCKKVIVFQNFEYLAEFMPVSTSFDQLGILDAITTSEDQKRLIQGFFPYLNVRVIEPGISGMFRPLDEPQNLVVNIVAKDQTDVNKIIKSFYWKFPIYKWVSFRDLRGMSQENFAEALRTGAITIWDDPKTRFGYSAIEALKSKSIVLGKIPENKLDWAINDDGSLTNDIIWFGNELEIPELIASVVRSWTLDLIPEEIYSGMDKYKDMYKLSDFETKTAEIIDKEFNQRRINDYKEVETIISREKGE